MKINSKRKINASSEALWAYLGDYANIYRFNPLIKHSNFNDGTVSCEVGSTRQCDMATGDYLKEKVTEWEEGSHYSVDIYETSMPVKRASATLGVRKIDDNTSEAYMHIDMESKYAALSPVLYLMYKLIGAPAILRGLDKLQRSEAQLKVASA